VAPAPGGYVLRDGVLDFSPLVLILLNCREPAEGAALFHATVAAGLANWLIAASKASSASNPATMEAKAAPRVDGPKMAKIAVGGGCAMNVVLMSALRSHLDAAGLILLEAHQAPPNDGGLALGQAWVGRAASQNGLPGMEGK
jgi:hydrogenase maturation protein HypF